MEEEKVNSLYFGLIHDQLSRIGNRAPPDSVYFRWSRNQLSAIRQLIQLKQLKMGVRFMKLFCLCLDTFDEESTERLRPMMITPFKVIWLKDNVGLSLLERLDETRLIDKSIILELDAKILESKQKFEGWCEILMQSISSSMNCHSSSFSKIRYYLTDIRNCLIQFYSDRTAAKIVPLKKQLYIFIAKLVFLEESLKNVECCSNSKDILQFLNFALAFSNNSSCFACLYWSKEDNEENATKMNLVLFYMFQKFIPWASDIIPLYICILKSHNLQPSDSFLLEDGEVLESFVDFFFEHMHTILEDDFLILRYRLTLLFTFLIDPPCENAQEEDLIRRQIYDLFHKDAYLLLPFDKMKDDFSGEKKLLGDCMIKIDITVAKIRELHCGFADSGIKLEQVEKMEYVYFVSVQRELSRIEKHAKWADPVIGQLQFYRTELRFLRVFLLCFTTWDDNDEEIRIRLSSMITSLHRIWEEKEEKGLLAHRLHAIRIGGGLTDWHLLAFELEGKLQLSKLKIEAWWLIMFGWSFRCKPSTTYKILKFLDSIIRNLKDLVTYKAGDIVPFKKQIKILEGNVVFLKIFLKRTVNCINSKNLGEFNMFVQVFANDAACLTFLYWTKDANDRNSSETNCVLSHMLQKIKSSTSDVARFYFETLKAIYVQESDSRMFEQTVVSFVDLFLDDDFQSLKDEILFLLTFLNDPPDKNAKESVYSQIDVFLWEGLYGLPFDDIERDLSKKKVLLNDFMTTIQTINVHIRHTYCKFQDPSLYNFPKIISPQFLDFLIQNLRNLNEKLGRERKYAPFVLIKFEKELVSLCPFFNHISDLQSEQNETWLEVVNSVHLTEHVISSYISSRFVFYHHIWYHMAYLFDVLDRIKVVRKNLEKIKENTTYNARCLPCLAGFISTPSEQARPSEINEIVVGFEDESEKIIRKLTWGHESLDIVSIVGMGGLGKTTLAKKVYGSSAVKCNFDVFAFCSVSQDHNTRRLLLDILCDIKGADDRNSDMTDDDLAHQLWKCLSHQKYLIVLDDIWNISAWNEVKNSFPDHKNGSRVMFTTRSHEVANKCKISCHPYKLRFLSAAESWELLQKKVFDNGIAPPHLYEIGMLISENCKGLPLAVVVIAGLLARTEKSLKWWSEVAERVVSYLSDEGCMGILELSYKHLPDNLKPCLLYLGAFPQDRPIKVKQVIMLWIAEGFVQESKTKSIEDVAKEYFHNLADRSLIVVSPRSSNGTFWGMKSLRHVKIDRCILLFSDEAYPILDNVVSFSKPCLSTGKDVQQLLQRLPSVRKLSCFLKESIDYRVESVEEILDFHRKLESLKLARLGKRSRYLINFPSTLKRLTLVGFQLPWTAISAIAELQCLQILKLRWISLPGSILEMEAMTFQNLKFFHLYNHDLVEWNASTESLPCLEQLVIECPKLKELPPCLGEISTLKRIDVWKSMEAESSALRIKEELVELGNQVEVSIYNSYSRRHGT